MNEPPHNDWKPLLERPRPDPGFERGIFNALLILAVLILGATAWLAFH